MPRKRAPMLFTICIYFNSRPITTRNTRIDRNGFISVKPAEAEIVNYVTGK
jgi:hypothetical protein